MHTTATPSLRLLPLFSLRSSLLRALSLTLMLLPAICLSLGAQCRLGVNSHGSQTLVLLPWGVVAGFGYNNSGQVGNGTRESPTAPANVLKGEYSGTRYLGDDPANPITAVAALYRHSLALASDGTVYGWGANNSGELGYQPLGNQFEPIRIRPGAYPGRSQLGDDPGNPIVAIGGGINSSMVLAGDGMLYGFGRNDYGQLGTASTDTTSLPTRVLKGEYPGTTYLGDDPANPVVAFAGGDYHYLALTRDGDLYSWGRNSNGQLGLGDTLSRSTPSRVAKGVYPGTAYIGDDPANRITMIRAGGSASLALLSDGTMLMWGGNGVGKLGDNTTDDRHTPVYVVAGQYPGMQRFGDSPQHPIVDVSVGSTHVVALTATGETYSWGSNLFGNLGSAAGQASSTPQRVRRGEYPGGTFFGDNGDMRIQAIAAAEDFTIAVVDSCDIYGWGRNHRLQLAEPSLNDHQTPIHIHTFTKDAPAGVEEEWNGQTGDPRLSIVPHPMRSQGAMAFHLMEGGDIRLDLFDASGEHIMRLADGYHAAGRHRTVFDATQLSSGLYCCRLQAGRRASVQWIVVLK